MEKVLKGNFNKKETVKRGGFFTHLKTLVMLQLKDKIDFSFLKSKKKTLFKVIYSILLFTGLTALITIMFSLIVKFGIFSFLQSILSAYDYFVFIVIFLVPCQCYKNALFFKR